MTLTDQQMLDLAGKQIPSGRLDTILHRAGLTRAQYLQRLNVLIDTLEGQALNPIVANNLRDRRERRRRGHHQQL